MPDAIHNTSFDTENNFPEPAGPSSDTAELAGRAINGDQRAWREMHRRYNPLIIGIGRKYRLSAANVDDLCQTVWLKLVVHLADLREPRALPGWIGRIARNEAINILTSDRRSEPADPFEDGRLEQVDHAELDEDLHRREQQQAVRLVLVELPHQHRQLFDLLMSDPQVPYSEISRRLGIPIGSIGPTRKRCLERLRRTPAVQALGATLEAA